MSAFLSVLRVDILPPSQVTGRQLYVLVEPFSYESETYGKVVVPAGFKTDFASIPRIAWRYLDPEDKCILYPSVIHDYIYSQSGALADGVVFTREQADKIFKEAMELAGARLDQRFFAFKAVRLFGGSHWAKL